MGTTLTIGKILGLLGFDLSKKIKLVRHKDNRQTKIINGEQADGTPYEWYRWDKAKFMAYQSEQHLDIFKGVDFIISFIGEESTTARFIGIYRILGYDQNKKNKLESGNFYYILEEVDGFDDLKERIIIDWGKSTLAWHQWLDKRHDKPIIAITAGFENEFPGYDNVLLNYTQLHDIILNRKHANWRNKLTACNCIYVISDRKTGKLYIGSTYNRDGIWGRWAEYAKTGGHGNNKKLMAFTGEDKNYAQTNLYWSILQILPINISDDEAIKKECLWKNKLGREACALNGN